MLKNLWQCLVCFNVGCGRYIQGHAHKHFQKTNHIYSKHLSTNRVWDYAADDYVHRLLQNKTDGKLVGLDQDQNVKNNMKYIGLYLKV